jgi:hypothetical protein
VNGEIPGGVVLLFFVFVFDVGRGEPPWCVSGLGRMGVCKTIIFTAIKRQGGLVSCVLQNMFMQSGLSDLLHKAKCI